MALDVATIFADFLMNMVRFIIYPNGFFSAIFYLGMCGMFLSLVCRLTGVWRN